MQSGTGLSSTAETCRHPDRSGPAGPFAEQGLGFIERCAGADTQACVIDFLATIRQMGCIAAAGGAWAGIGKHRRHRFFFLNWPAEWIELYEKNGWFAVDPLPVEARRRIAPFLYSELDESKMSVAQRAFIAAGRAFGWQEIFAVPIHGPASLQGMVTIAIQLKHSLSPGDRAVLEMMARTVWERCRTSEGFGTSDRDEVKFSPREVECLQWVAAGKSDGDIAAILGISAATVHYHVERAKQRLGVSTRVEAVAIGVLTGVI